MTVILKAKPRIPETSLLDRETLWGKILRMTRTQIPGATDGAPVGFAVADQALRVRAGYFVLGLAFGAGESITVDVTVDGTSILAAPQAIPNGTVKGDQIPLVFSAAFIAANQQIAKGAIVRMQNTMNGGTTASNSVTLEVEPAS